MDKAYMVTRRYLSDSSSIPLCVCLTMALAQRELAKSAIAFRKSHPELQCEVGVNRFEFCEGFKCGTVFKIDTITLVRM